MVAYTNRLNRRYLFLAIIFSVNLFVLLLSRWSFGEQLGSAKDEITQGILRDLQLYYYVNPKYRGKTFEIVIKDFTPGDKETYAIIDDLRRFLVIYLPENGKYKLSGTVCCKDFPLKKARKDLVSKTRKKGLKLKFSVPTHEKDLPQ